MAPTHLRKLILPYLPDDIFNKSISFAYLIFQQFATWLPGRRLFHGSASSQADASRISEASSPKRVANCTPIGRWILASYRGRVIAGCPVTFSNNHHQTPLNAEKPPSIGTTIPVTNADAGETNHKTAPSKSSGVPKRFIGVCWRIL